MIVRGLRIADLEVFVQGFHGVAGGPKGVNKALDMMRELYYFETEGPRRWVVSVTNV